MHVAGSTRIDARYRATTPSPPTRRKAANCYVSRIDPATFTTARHRSTSLLHSLIKCAVIYPPPNIEFRMTVPFFSRKS